MKLPEFPPEFIFSLNNKVATITLNRPEKLNTMTPDMGKALLELVPYINGNDDIRVVILTGSGTKAFSAGVMSRFQINMDLIGNFEIGLIMQEEFGLLESR